MLSVVACVAKVGSRYLFRMAEVCEQGSQLAGELPGSRHDPAWTGMHACFCCDYEFKSRL